MPAKRILIVDDNLDSAESMAWLFRMAGNEPRVVGEGAAAAAQAREFRPHVVLLDIGLPDLDGYEVAREMRRHRELDHTLIVAVSGQARDEVMRKGAGAGIDACMAKPIDLDTLSKWIAAGRAATASNSPRTV